MDIFNKLQYYSKIFLSSKAPKYKRDVYNEIDFSQKCVGLKGAKGIGKTTILHQYLNSINEDKLYISLDNPIIGDMRILDIAEMAFKMDIKVLAIDEIHYQKDFANDLKTIYDFFDIKVLFSGSSAIALSNADLSRRAVVYTLPVLSFREFIELKEKINFPKYSLEDILSNHQDLAYEIISKIKPLKYFKEYLSYGAYPFFLESDKNTYFLKLTETINKTIQSDLLYLFNIDSSNIQLLKKLLVSLCQNPPGSLNLTALSKDIGINARTLYNYITALEKGDLIHLLYYNKKGNAIFQKPDKILLNNPNLFQILCDVNIGSQRESFFISQLNKFDIKYSKKGDYIVNDKYIFEIGGPNKSFKQVKDLNNSFVVSDDIEVGFGNRLPLWLFGFLY
ncbi:MAG TPA: ATP-binding protein [Campylobacterales bacterium]|nr:ATP-binding protein [Campylobacterales bacterium]